MLATGDELVPPGTEPGPGQIVYSNGFALAALARREGAEVIDLGIVPDQLDETIAAIRRARAAGADVLVTTGGASVGDYDLVQQALAAEGLALSFWKVALRPGKPLMHGPARRDARARPAGQSGVGLCLRVPVPGAADPPARRPQRPRRCRPNRRCSAATCRRTTSAPTTCARRSTDDADGTLVATPVPGPGFLHAGPARRGRLPGGARAVCARRAGRQPVRHR